jgi:glutamate-ammonia-ligase adenylyltransferase
MQALLRRFAQEGEDTGAALRILRQLVLERLVVLDCDAQVGLEDVTLTMTTLAELTLDVAFEESSRTLDALHGAPLGPSGERAQLCIVGMGKLGARELNVSSDIDLIYVYDHDGETAGNAQQRNKISNHEYFGKQVRAIYTLVGDTTEHGFVFRVDLALRPNGNSGPSAVSLAALDEYFQVQGREGCVARWFRSYFANTWTTTYSMRCAACTGRFATTQPSAVPATQSGATTSSSRVAASVRSSSRYSYSKWCAAVSFPSCAPAQL